MRGKSHSPHHSVVCIERDRQTLLESSQNQNSKWNLKTSRLWDRYRQLCHTGLRVQICQLWSRHPRLWNCRRLLLSTNCSHLMPLRHLRHCHAACWATVLLRLLYRCRMRFSVLQYSVTFTCSSRGRNLRAPPVTYITCSLAWFTIEFI